MTSILAAISRIYRNSFKRNFLINKRLFPIFHGISEMCMKLRAFSKKKMSNLAYLFPKFLTRRDLST